jgi:hypothetical protein
MKLSDDQNQGIDGASPDLRKVNAKAGVTLAPLNH